MKSVTFQISHKILTKTILKFLKLIYYLIFEMKANIASSQGQGAAISRPKQTQADIDVGQLCVKVRREKVTHFFLCKPLETIQSLKKKVSMFVKGSDPSDIRLYLSTRLLDDKSNIHDQDVRNNSLLHYKLKKGNTGEWEEFPELGI